MTYEEERELLRLTRENNSMLKQIIAYINIHGNHTDEMYEDDEDDVESEYRNGGQAYGRGEDEGMNMRRVRYRRGM